jgi:cobalt/nickel transport system permease protein
LIGLGEAIITALTVGSVIAVRPDLVYAARGLQPELVLKGADGEVIGTAPTTTPAPKRPIGPAVIGALVVSFLLAGVVSFFASSNPDGLEYVAEDQGFLESAKDSAVGEFIFADYGEVGGIPVGIAGILGVVVVLLIGWGIGKWVARGRGAEAADSDPQFEKV